MGQRRDIHADLHQEGGMGRVLPPAPPHTSRSRCSSPQTHTHTHTRTPRTHLTSWVPKKPLFCKGDRNNWVSTRTFRQAHSPILVVLHLLFPSFTHTFTHASTPSLICYIFAQLIHPLDSDCLLADPCIHLFMLPSDLSIKPISFINSMNICTQCLLCIRHHARLRAYRSVHARHQLCSPGASTAEGKPDGPLKC